MGTDQFRRPIAVVTAILASFVAAMIFVAVRGRGTVADVLFLIVMSVFLLRFGMSAAPRLVAHFQLRKEHKRGDQR